MLFLVKEDKEGREVVATYTSGFWVAWREYRLSGHRRPIKRLFSNDFIVRVLSDDNEGISWIDGYTADVRRSVAEYEAWCSYSNKLRKKAHNEGWSIMT